MDMVMHMNMIPPIPPIPNGLAPRPEPKKCPRCGAPVDKAPLGRVIYYKCYACGWDHEEPQMVYTGGAVA